MHALHIIPYMHPAAGGPPVVVERLVEQAPANSWSSSVLTTSQFCEDDGHALEIALRERLEVTVLPQERPRLLGLDARAEDRLDDCVRRADIVHIHTLWHPLNTAARRACTRHGRRYVLAPHGMLDPYSLGVKAMRKRLYLELREARNLEGASRLIFTTPLEEQLARANLPWLGDSNVIPLGADRPPSVSRGDLVNVFNARFPCTAGRRCLVFLGRLHPKKGVEHILAILPEIIIAMPDVLLIIAGTGEANYLAYLHQMVQRLGLTSHVLFAGFLQGDAKWGSLAVAEAFLLPSYQENFAVAVAEAMHMGIPVIVSAKVNIWPFVAGADAGIVLRGQLILPELKEAIAGLLANPDKARDMGARGQQFARQNFDWWRVAELMFALYDHLISCDNSASSKGLLAS